MGQLRAISLNMWGLGMGISADREQRMRALGEAFPTLGADIIGLQEIWLESDQKYLLRQAQNAGLEHGHYFRSGVIGSGVMTLSRFPILEAHFQAYRLSSRPEYHTQGDYYAGKGMGLVRLQTPYGDLDVYNTHAIAQYAPDYQDDLAGLRASNMYEAANFIQHFSHHNPAIVLGDFNVNPHQLGYQLLCTLANLTDCYEVIYPNDLSITFSLDNPYNSNYREPERIDYVCVRDGVNIALTPIQAEVTLKRQPDYPYKPYSDHYGVQADIEISHHELPRPQASASEMERVLDLFYKELVNALDQTMSRRNNYRWRMMSGFGVGVLSHLRLQTHPRHAHTLFYLFGAIIGLVIGIFYLLLSNIFIPQEIQALRAMANEVRLKMITLKRSQTLAYEVETE